MRNFINVHVVRMGLFLLLASSVSLNAQQTARHEVTLYAFPTMLSIDWESPSTLYRTAKHCFYKTMSLKDNYLLGHIAVSLSTPLLPQKKLLAMTAANKMQRVNLILKEKIGLAILGATLDGKIESEDHLNQMINVYTGRNKLAYMTFCVSEAAMNRMLDFISKFTRNNSDDVQPSLYYGGVYWPLYENEGAGCSAFALGILASANLLPPEASNWLKDVNVPMQLIGGEYNHNIQIPFNRIRKAKKWYEGDGQPNVDYVNVQTYDPSTLFNWILDMRTRNNSTYVAQDMNGVPGLIVDCTSKVLPEEKPYFVKRGSPNLFMDIYRQKHLQHAAQPTP